jgi:hypothetical protein
VVPQRAADEVAEQVQRLADHLRRLPESRLRRRHDDLGGMTGADAAREVAQWLCDTEATLVPDDGRPPTLPRLPDLAVGDQVAVTGQDLVDALRRSGDVDPGLVDDAVSRLRRVRLVV